MSKEHDRKKSDLTDILMRHQSFTEPDTKNEPLKDIREKINENSNSKLELKEILVGIKPIKNQVDSKTELKDILLGDNPKHFFKNGIYSY